MIVENSLLEDMPEIFDLYETATAYMKSKNQVHWPVFPQELIIAEIAAHRQWKLIIDQKIACIWATALSDELIWQEKNNTPSLYLHRIATNPDFRGRRLFNEVMTWANKYGQEQGLRYIRMDTVGLNKGLIDHYEKFGFQFLGTKKLEQTGGLPAHYKDGDLCLFQKEII